MFISIADPQQNPAGFIDISELAPTEKPKPRTSDLHPLRFEIAPEPVFSGEIQGDRPIDVAIGEAVKFVASRDGDTFLVGALWQITRAPRGSKAELSGSRLIPDKGGAYVVTCTLGGFWVRTITIAALPPEVFDERIGYLPTQRLEKRRRLRAILHDRNATPESIAAGIEGDEIDLATLAGYTGKKRGAFRLENYR